MKKLCFWFILVLSLFLNFIQFWFGAEIKTYANLNKYVDILASFSYILVIGLLILLLNYLLQIWLMPIFSEIDSKELKKKKNTSLIIFFYLLLYIPMIELYDYRSYISFNSYYDERMNVIKEYITNENYNSGRYVVTLPENMKKLSINRKMIIDNNEYFYFYISEDQRKTNNHYLVYTKSSTDIFYQKGQIVSLEKLADNWYYLKCDF